MSGKFCFVCGKETNDLIEGRCKKCSAGSVKLVKAPDEISITMCSKCGLIKVKNDWKLATLEMAVLDKIKVLEKDAEINLERTKSGFVITSGKEKHNVHVKINKMVCPICARKFTQYYDAVLQIRGKYNDEIIDFIDEQLFLISKTDQKAFYTIRKPKEGIDVRLGSKSAASKIADRARRKYNVEIKKSFMLVGKKKDRTLYRDIILLRFI